MIESIKINDKSIQVKYLELTKVFVIPYSGTGIKGEINSLCFMSESIHLNSLSEEKEFKIEIENFVYRGVQLSWNGLWVQVRLKSEERVEKIQDMLDRLFSYPGQIRINRNLHKNYDLSVEDYFSKYFPKITTAEIDYNCMMSMVGNKTVYQIVAWKNNSSEVVNVFHYDFNAAVREMLKKLKL